MRSVQWQEQAECTKYEPEWWFPNSPGRAGQREAERAMAICRQCPVIIQCNNYANSFTSGLQGVWAGKVHASKKLFVDDIFTQPHGTEAGYKRHWVANEPACTPCREAASFARKVRDEAKKGRTA